MEFVRPTTLAEPLGDFSHAVVSAGLVFLAGTIGLDKNGGLPGDGGAEAQTKQALENVSDILEAKGLTLASIVSATIYLQDMNDYGAFSAAWAEAFGDHKPARATVRAELAHPSLKVEVQAIAELSKD